MNPLIFLADGAASVAAPVAAPVETPPQTLLIYVLLGIILGAAGQGIRAIVGWKQMHDQAANTDTSMDDIFQVRTLVMSFGIGAVAGVCATLGLVASGIHWDTSTILGIMAAGYAGADFIEGFASQYLPKGNSPAANKSNTAPAPTDDPNAAAAKEEKLSPAPQG